MATTILVTKKNEAFLHIDCEKSVAQELSDYFAFYVPNYQFSPLFKKKMWDGKIRLANISNRTLPGGLVDYLRKFATDRDYDLVVDDAVLLTTNFSLAEAERFASGLHLPHVPRPYQLEAFVKSIRNRRALIVSPTASGKSLILYMIVRYLQRTHRKGLIIVPTTSLVEQLFTDFRSYGWDADTYVHRLYAGKEKHTKHFLTISTWQTLHLQSPEYLAQFDFVIGDEAHLAKGKSLSTILAHLINANVRIGTTGTLDGTTTHRLVLEGHFGPVFQAATTKELMEGGYVSPLKIKCLILKYPKPICESLKKSDYRTEYETIIGYGPRAKFIHNLALSLRGNTLILFQLVEKHGKPLFEGLRDATDKHQVFFVHGGVETEEREEVRRITERSTNAIVVASYGTMSTGTNIRNLHNLIFASPSKSKIRNLQSIGRELRLSEGKDHATLFDIVDDLRVGKHDNYLLKHFIERVAIYNSEKFPMVQYYIDLKS